MEQQAKRLKPMEEHIIADITSSISDIASSLKSISESYNDILKVNKTVVKYLQNLEKHENRINLDQSISSDLQRTSVREK